MLVAQVNIVELKRDDGLAGGSGQLRSHPGLETDDLVLRVLVHRKHHRECSDRDRHPSD